MGLEEKTYSVLVVSSSETFNSATSDMLPAFQYQPVTYAKSVNEAKRHIADRAYDFIIINSPLPDGSGARFAIDCCRAETCAVLLLARSDVYAEICDKVVPYGVFTLPKPTSKSIIAQALIWMSSARERLRRLQKKALSVEERMEEIRVINRAKLILVSELQMTEKEAHRYIEKQAMDNCVSKRNAAENIIKIYS